MEANTQYIFVIAQIQDNGPSNTKYVWRHGCYLREQFDSTHQKTFNLRWLAQEFSKDFFNQNHHN